MGNLFLANPVYIYISFSRECVPRNSCKRYIIYAFKLNIYLLEVELASIFWKLIKCSFGLLLKTWWWRGWCGRSYFSTPSSFSEFFFLFLSMNGLFEKWLLISSGREYNPQHSKTDINSFFMASPALAYWILLHDSPFPLCCCPCLSCFPLRRLNFLSFLFLLIFFFFFFPLILKAEKLRKEPEMRLMCLC